MTGEAGHVSGLYTVRNGETITVRAPDGSMLAQMTFLTRTGRRDADEVAATAQLFAAAPEMYAALMLAEDACTNSDHAAAEKARRAALSKARG